MINIKNISKKFDNDLVLKGVSLQIKKGEVVALIGPSGSGKTTFLRCLNLLEIPDTGTIEFKTPHLTIDIEKKIGKKELLVLRRRTGMVFQQHYLFPHKTALENVIEGLLIVQKMPFKKAKEEGSLLLQKVGLQEKADLYPEQLSGGQQQRVGIARALAIKPDLILLDEPTSALDPELISDLLQVLKRLVKEGWTMLIATHEMNFAQEVADRIVFMEDGEVITECSSDSFFITENQRLKSFIGKASPNNLPSDYAI